MGTAGYSKSIHRVEAKVALPDVSVLFPDGVPVAVSGYLTPFGGVRMLPDAAVVASFGCAGVPGLTRPSPTASQVYYGLPPPIYKGTDGMGRVGPEVNVGGWTEIQID